LTTPLTREKRGRTLGCAIHGKSPRFFSIRKIRTAFLLRPWGIRTARTPSEEFFARPMEVRRSRKFCIRAKTRARPIWRLIRRTHGQFTRPCGPLGSRRSEEHTSELQSPDHL